MQQIRIIGITGQVGAGKSTFALALSTSFSDVSIFDIDHYKLAGLTEFPMHGSDDPEHEIAAWLARGANPQEYVRIPPLRDDLQTLRAGKAVTITSTSGEQRTFGPSSVVLFETHFGRDLPDAADLIDVQIHLDVPLDVSLARKLMQISRSPQFDPQAYLNSYLKADRLVLERMRQAGRHAEIMLSGIEPAAQLAKQAVDQLAGLLPEGEAEPVKG